MVVEWNNGDTIIKLVTKGVASIVDYNDILQASIGKDSHVLNVEAFFGLNTVLSEKSVLNVFIFRVKIVKDNISIAAVRSSENDDFKVLWEFLQAFNGIGSHINTSFNNFTMRELDGQDNITGYTGVFVAMDQGFIKIENNGLLI